MFAYEKLDVYTKAYNTNQSVYHLLKENRTIEQYIKNQLGRASLSIMLNIAEGSAKFRSRDRRNFYTISRGSAFECAALISFLFDEGEIAMNTKQNLYSSFEEISKMLFVMIKNLHQTGG